VTKASELAHLFHSLKAPAAARALPKLAERAREESRGYERFAEALLSTEGGLARRSWSPPARTCATSCAGSTPTSSWATVEAERLDQLTDADRQQPWVLAQRPPDLFPERV
jgi:hypothetical protein